MLGFAKWEKVSSDFRGKINILISLGIVEIELFPFPFFKISVLVLFMDDKFIIKMAFL